MGGLSEGFFSGYRAGNTHCQFESQCRNYHSVGTGKHNSDLVCKYFYFFKLVSCSHPKDFVKKRKPMPSSLSDKEQSDIADIVAEVSEACKRG